MEIFPLRTRVTSMSFAHSIALALTGGTAPLVAAFYALGLGAIALALLVPMEETNSRALDRS